MGKMFEFAPPVSGKPKVIAIPNPSSGPEATKTAPWSGTPKIYDSIAGQEDSRISGNSVNPYTKKPNSAEA